jgi:hypothetical protein
MLEVVLVVLVVGELVVNASAMVVKKEKVISCVTRHSQSSSLHCISRAATLT